MYRITARTPTKETPFRLIYGNETVILAEIGLTSYRVDNHNEARNDEALRLQLDLIDEVRAIAEQRLALQLPVPTQGFQGRRPRSKESHGRC